MDTTGYNPQELSAEILAKMPDGARLLRDDEERKAFELEALAKSDLFSWWQHLQKWVPERQGDKKHVTYCTTRPLNWDKSAAAEKARVLVVEGDAMTVATAREWFIPVIDHAGVGDNWQSDNPMGALDAAKQVIRKSHRPGALALIVRVKLPCKTESRHDSTVQG